MCASLATCPLGCVSHPAALLLSPQGGSAHIIDGKAIADTVRKEVADKVSRMKAKTGKVRPLVALWQRRQARRREPNCKRGVTFGGVIVAQVPGLAVVLVGSRKVSVPRCLCHRGRRLTRGVRAIGLGDVCAQQEESLRRVRHGQLRHRPT